MLGVLPGIVGSIQALEAIKLILDLGDPLVGRLLAYDALETSFRTFKVRRDPNCPACGEPDGTRSSSRSTTSCACPTPSSPTAASSPTDAHPVGTQRRRALRSSTSATTEAGSTTATG